VEDKVKLKVVPNYWSGFGVLGCHFYNLIAKDGAFIKVMNIHKESPAYRCGLREGDRIIEFGSINAETYVDYEKSILPFIENSGLGNPIHVLFLRPGSLGVLSLEFTPQRWSGSGYVGFHFKRIKPHSIIEDIGRSIIGKVGVPLPAGIPRVVDLVPDLGITKTLSGVGSTVGSLLPTSLVPSMLAPSRRPAGHGTGSGARETLIAESPRAA
jgi:hypothetical protein